MFNLQGSEIIIILLLALVVLGPEKLPDAIRKFSQTYGELKKMGNGFQSELKSALDEPMQEIRKTADMVQRAADPKRIIEEAESEARLRSEADAAALTGTTDVPVDPAALEVSDPAAEAGQADCTDADVADDADSPPVNQIALSMARGPVEPATSEPSESPEPAPLTTPPTGAASMLVPPPSGATPSDVLPPPPSLPAPHGPADDDDRLAAP